MRLLGLKSDTPWPLRVEPLDEEIASSWLVRAARAYDETPHIFAQLAWEDLPVWNRDLDTTLTLGALRTLAQRMQVDPARGAATSLSPYLPRLGGQNPAWVPGLLRAGIYHRTRRRHGQQYCASCLAEDHIPYFRRQWRLAFMFTCTRHACLLRDACPECSAPVVAHRTRDLDLRRCHVCDADLVCNVTAASGLHMNAQAVVMDAWDRDVVDLGAMQISFTEWLRGLRVLWHVLHSPGVARWILGEGDCEPPPYHERAVSLELALIDERAALLPAAVWLLAEWPDHMITTGRELEFRITEVIDPKRSQGPAWLLDVLKQHLPYDPRHRGPTRRKVGRARLSAYTARRSLDLAMVLRQRLDDLTPTAETVH